MKRILILFVFIVVSISSCDILNQVGEVKRFAQCDFQISIVQIVNLGGVDVSNYTSSSDFGFSDMLIIGQKLFSGKLQSKLSVDILATNNQTSKAAISALDWQLTMQNEKYGEGKIVDYIEVLPSQSTIFTVIVDFDFLKLIQSENLQSIIDLVMDIENKEKLNKLDILLKVKPYYKSGNSIKEYPGYLNIRP